MGRNALAPDASLAPLLDSLQAGKLGRQLVYSTSMPSTPPRYGELDPPLPPSIAQALARSGVARLWSHQAEGIAAVRRGENVLVTTPTASGKSLVFQLPALEEAAVGGPGRALFLFPLKALGQDQRGKFLKLAQEAGLPADVAGCEIYDGDTPRALREAIRRNFPRVVVSNPDMLHLGVLGHWTGWGPYLADLRWIVLDELHTYRGIFGSHFHHVLARFLRLCHAVGAKPQIIASSATAANAAEFAETLTGQPFHWIGESGAPREGRHLLLFRPSGSPYTTALQLFITLVQAGMKTIVFTKARRITELLYSWLRRQEPELARRVASYRAGFLPEERRQVERDLFEGRLDGVISTSALEMGVDVGGLDACILVGYPGSMMATWQRSGRVGRDGRESITAMVALPDALDQYFLDHPQQFLERPCERLIVDPGNSQVARGHLVCAASELPLSRTGDRSYLERHAPLIGDLLREGKLAEAVDDGELHSTRRRPQREINLRGSGKTFTIENLTNGRVIGTVDGVRAYHECHPGAVYLHAGRQFLVEELRIEEHRVRAMPAIPADLDYFTTPLTEKETEILEVLAERTDGPLTARLGRLKVTEKVVGFERKRIQGQEVIDRQTLDLPPSEFETVGLWWLAGKPIEQTIARAGEHFMGSLHASEHAAISLVPTFALCDRGDLGGISMPFHPQVGCGTVFLYDGHPGGVGIMLRVFEDLPDLLGRVLALLDACSCEVGCPSCVQSPKCGNGNRPLDKGGAARVLRLLLGKEEAVVVGEEETRDRNPPVAAAPPGDKSPGYELRRMNPASRDGEVVGLHARADRRASTTLSSRGSAFLRWLRERFRFPSSRPRGPRTVLFDLETLRSAADVGGWHNCHRMGIAMGVVCHLEEDRFEVFPESRVEALAATLCAADLVVGFNIRRFDYRVLAGYTGENYEQTLPTLDLLDEVRKRLGFRLGMGHLAKETLGCDKSADGLQSLEWVRQGRLDLVEAYCRKDVEILRDLFLHGRREGCLYYRRKGADAKLRLPVEW
ncbi:MAG TPA: DEAD/DEAH box helicase [Thermoanaerobaculia bacterium]|nr:DEAD/DEAH box helicase [Thermoanaerobaculia bacterium]